MPIPTHNETFTLYYDENVIVSAPPSGILIQTKENGTWFFESVSRAKAGQCFSSGPFSFHLEQLKKGQG